MVSYSRIVLYCSIIYFSFSGKCDADAFDETCSNEQDLNKLSFPIQDPFLKHVGCRAHFISPNFMLTAASCFNDSSPQHYSIHLNYERGSSVRPIAYTRIKKIHYSNSESKNDGHLALAELEEKLVHISNICIDWHRNFQNNLKDFIFGGWTLGNLTDEYSSEAIEKQVYGYAVSCENSTFSSTTDLSENDDCFRVDNGFVMQKGVGFYVSYGFNYYLKGIAIETSPKPSNTALFTSLTKYLNWMNSVINGSNYDYDAIE